MGPRPPLRCWATLGEGASLSSSMCQLSAIKAQLMGAVVTGGRGVTKPPLERDKKAGLLPRQRGMLGLESPLTRPRGSHPPPAAGHRWAMAARPPLFVFGLWRHVHSRPTAEARTGFLTLLSSILTDQAECPPSSAFPDARADCLGSSPSFATFWLCDLWHVTSPLGLQCRHLRNGHNNRNHFMA